MKRQLHSLMTGAAVAVVAIAPSVPGLAQTGPHAPPAPAAPPMPSAPPHAGDWVQLPPRTFVANRVKLDDIVGTLVVAVRPSGPVTVEIAGGRYRVNDIDMRQEDGRVLVDCSSEGEDNESVWDWRNWFNFSHDHSRGGNNLIVTVTVPRGADVDVEDLVGHADIGDTMGRLHFEAAATKARIGHVASAKVSLGGLGQVDIAAVDQQLDLELGGSGKFFAGPTGSVHADIAGSGEARLGAIAGGLTLDIAGSGDITAERVNGPTHIDIAGSGSVRIADGIADPLHVDIMGAGNLYFGGVAIDPHIDALGAGMVHLKAYRGRLDSEGMANVKIGD